MGSTGHSAFRGKGKGAIDNDTFGIKGAVVFKGKVPPASGLDKPSANKITLKVPSTRGDNILFQFRLSKDSRTMTIIGYRNSVPEIRSKVAVDSVNPSLDKVMKDGSKAQRQQAVKMKDLFSKSTQIKENQLQSIAQKLLNKKKQREENR